jgi:8-oxo-dGTP diphosphatase
MKVRATVVCRRGSRFLLVTKSGSRWSLPGGKVKAGEPLMCAATRELREETNINSVAISPLFEFDGLRTRHYVFEAALSRSAYAAPSNEIRRCGWFLPWEVTRLRTSVSTRGIMELVLWVESRARRINGSHCPTVQRATEPGLHGRTDGVPNAAFGNSSPPAGYKRNRTGSRATDSRS